MRTMKKGKRISLLCCYLVRDCLRFHRTMIYPYNVVTALVVTVELHRYRIGTSMLYMKQLYCIRCLKSVVMLSFYGMRVRRAPDMKPVMGVRLLKWRLTLLEPDLVRW
jgi:hypothetical protein